MRTKWMILVIIGAILTLACGFPGFFSSRNLRGSGNVETETREVSDFQRVSIDGVGELHLVQGEQESLRIEAEDNILDKIETRVVGGKLTIGYESGFLGWNIVPTEPIRFYLTLPELDEMTVNGGVKIMSEAWEGNDLLLTINGAADIELESVSLNRLELRLEGGSDCEISGETGSLEVRVDGAGAVDLDELRSSTAEITVNGLSDVRVWVTDSLDVEINGAGQVGFYGDPEVTSVINGLGSVQNLGEK